MKSSDYARFSILAGALALGACGADGTFSGSGGPAAGGGGLAGGGGGGGGGGPTVGIEPIMQYGPEEPPGFGKVQIAGDSSKIVFVDDADPFGDNPNETWQLFAFDIGSKSILQITDGSATAISDENDFDLTDSGDAVVWSSIDDFVGNNPNNQLNVFTASTTTGTISQVTSIDAGAAGNPQISRNDVVVFLSADDLVGDNPGGDVQIFSINADGSGLAQVTNQVLFPESLSLSDNGNKVAFQGSGDPVGANADGSTEIFVIDTDGNNIMQITDSAGDSVIPKITDDGSRVIFVSREDLSAGGNADGSYELFSALTDGSSIVQLSADDTRNSGTFSGSGDPGAYDISGNGNWVVFSSSANLDSENDSNDLTLFWTAAEGGQVRQLLREGTIAEQQGVPILDADKASMPNDGAGMAFVATTNFTSFDVPTFAKIYTTNRQ